VGADIQNLTDWGKPRGEDVALECFLKFQPPTFFGVAEQDQRAEQKVEQMEDIFQTLEYSERHKVKFNTFRLRGPARD
jgi:hypothetical protein